jgi:hypothetical protein
MYPPEHRKVVSGMPAVYMDVQILFMYNILKFSYHKSLSGEYEHPTSRNRGPSDGPLKQNGCNLD